MEMNDSILNDSRLTRHNKLISKLLPATTEHGYYALHSILRPPISISKERLDSTFLNLDLTYSESLSHASIPVPHLDGYSRIYEVRDANRNLVNSQVTSCYFDGYIVTDGYIDVFYEGNDGLNPNWFFYKIQRHLQLSREVFLGYSDQLTLILDFKHIERFYYETYQNHHLYEKYAYSGYHRPIIYTIPLTEIHGRDNWNIKMDIVIGVMTNVAKIFGLESLPQNYWLDDGELDYSHNISTR